MIDYIKEAAGSVITPGNVLILALGAIGAIVSYRAGNRVGNRIYWKYFSEKYPPRSPSKGDSV